MRTLAVGVVGCGRNSDNHLRVYANTEGVRLAAVCDVDSARAEEKSRKYGADRVFTEYDGMLDLDLDLVDIVTPPPTHAELSVFALESGHNVLVEKPMALSSEECLSMIRAAEKSGRTLSVMHNKRFFDCIVGTKDLIDREGLRVSRARVSHFYAYGHARPGWILTEESGGILWEALVHHVYLVQHFLGRVESVSAVARKVKQPVYDSLTLLLRAGGGVGVCEYDYDVREPLEMFQLVTEEGDRFDADLINDFVIRRSRSYRDGIPGFFSRVSDDLYGPFVKRAGYLRRFLERPSYGRATPFTRTFVVLIRQLLSFLVGEAEAPPVSAVEGLEAIRVLEATRRSIETGRSHSPG